MSELQAWATAHIKNPQATLDADAYNCIFVHDVHGEVPFTAARHDSVGYGAMAFMCIKDGLCGEIAPVPQASLEALFEDQRNQLLSQSAIAGIAYDELTEEQKDELMTYRQALRALEYNAEVAWPAVPDFL